MSLANHPTHLQYAILLLLLTLINTSILTHAASRAYPQGCANFPPSYYDYEMYPLPPPDLPSRSHDDFSLLRRLGAGKFSDVFEAVDDGEFHGKNSKVSGNFKDKSYIDPARLCVIKVSTLKIYIYTDIEFD